MAKIKLFDPSEWGKKLSVRPNKSRGIFLLVETQVFVKKIHSNRSFVAFIRLFSGNSYKINNDSPKFIRKHTFLAIWTRYLRRMMATKRGEEGNIHSLNARVVCNLDLGQIFHLLMT